MIKKIAKTILIFLLNIFFALIFRRDIFKNTNVKQTINLYEKKGGFVSFFVKIRFWDSPFKEIENLVPPKGRILDLGCGDGISANYLAICSPKRIVRGIEIDRNRIKSANMNLRNTKFVKGDIVKNDFKGKYDAILLTHVLHHLKSREDQEKILLKCKKSLKRKGKLIITEIIERPVGKYIFTYLTDTLIVPILFGDSLIDNKFYYRKQQEWTRILSQFGYESKVKIASKGKPFSHAIYICKVK